MPDETRPATYPARILAAAEREFARAGFRDCRMAAVAATAGISLTTLYRHFAGKEALWDAVNATRMREFVAAVETAVGARAGVEALMVAARAEVHFFAARPDFLAMQLRDGLSWATTTPEPDLRHGGQRLAWEQGMGLIARAAAAARRRGEIDLEPDLVAALVVSALQIWLSRWLDHGRREAPEVIADQVVAHLRRCLGA